MPTYSFSALPSGSSYVVGDIVNPVDATIELTQFQLSDGSWTADGIATVVTSSFAGGSVTQELNLNNIMVRVIPDTPTVLVRYRYADLGGNINIGVNGDHQNVENLIDLNGAVIGGCDITVTQVVAPAGQRGVVEITPQNGNAIERFGVGGQEFYIDDVNFS